MSESRNAAACPPLVSLALRSHLTALCTSIEAIERDTAALRYHLEQFREAAARHPDPLLSDWASSLAARLTSTSLSRPNESPNWEEAHSRRAGSTDDEEDDASLF